MTTKRLKCEPLASIETLSLASGQDCPLVMTSKWLKCEPPTNIETMIKVYSVVKIAHCR